MESFTQEDLDEARSQGFQEGQDSMLEEISEARDEGYEEGYEAGKSEGESEGWNDALEHIKDLAESEQR